MFDSYDCCLHCFTKDDVNQSIQFDEGQLSNSALSISTHEEGETHNHTNEDICSDLCQCSSLFIPNIIPVLAISKCKSINHKRLMLGSYNNQLFRPPIA